MKKMFSLEELIDDLVRYELSCMVDTMTARLLSSTSKTMMKKLNQISSIKLDQTLQAANRGYVNVLRWLCNNHCRIHDLVCNEAAKNGHINVIKWAKERISAPVTWSHVARGINHYSKERCSVGLMELQTAVRHNHLEIVKEVVDSDNFTKICSNYSRNDADIWESFRNLFQIVTEAIKHNQREIAMYIIKCFRGSQNSESNFWFLMIRDVGVYRTTTCFDFLRDNRVTIPNNLCCRRIQIPIQVIDWLEDNQYISAEHRAEFHKI